MESFDVVELDNLVIKNKEYRKKKRIKIIKIISIIFAILIVIGVVLFIILTILANNYGKIICDYKTDNDNENIELINNYR